MKHLKFFESNVYGEPETLPYVFYISDSDTIVSDKNYLIEEGKFGDNDQFSWKFYGSGDLIISGQGEISGLWGNDCPWEDLKPSIQQIIVQEGITAISGCFQNCVNNKKVILPKSLYYVGDETFDDCCGTLIVQNDIRSESRTNFSKLILTKDVNAFNWLESRYTLERIVVDKDNQAFSSHQHCNALIKKDSNTLMIGTPTGFIPEDVSVIGNYAFKRCNITSIIIPASVTSIGYSTFGECANLTSITIPDNSQLTSIGNSAFSGCSSLASITIPKSVTSIEQFAFQACDNLSSMIVAEGNTVYDSRNNCNAIIETSSNTLIAGCASTAIPESVTSIGNSAFECCNNLTSINIPEGVTSIGWSAFNGCTSLNSIILPESLTSIESWAFGYCNSLSSIAIPESVTSIGDYAFSECSSITRITCSAVTPPTIYDSTFEEVDKSIPLYVPAQSVTTYKATNYWKDFTNIQAIPEME